MYIKVVFILNTFCVCAHHAFLDILKYTHLPTNQPTYLKIWHACIIHPDVYNRVYTYAIICLITYTRTVRTY